MKRRCDLRDQLRKGTRVEMEHTDDPRIARTIAKDHLREGPCYYEYLGEMEQQMREDAVENPGDDDEDDKPWRAPLEKLRAVVEEREKTRGVRKPPTLISPSHYYSLLDTLLKLFGPARVLYSIQRWLEKAGNPRDVDDPYRRLAKMIEDVIQRW